MSRPKVPMIERRTAIAVARSLIDRDGLDGFSMRRLAAELGVSGAALYHHFRDKQAILDGIRVSIVLESDVAAEPAADAPWEEHLRQTVDAYRALLLRHPNLAPLMHPSAFERPYGVLLREQVAERLLAGDVPAPLVHPIMDSVELLAYASAVLNPGQLPPAERMALGDGDPAPALRAAVAAAPLDADELFATQLDALLAGWSASVSRARG